MYTCRSRCNSPCITPTSPCRSRDASWGSSCSGTCSSNKSCASYVCPPKSCCVTPCKPPSKLTLYTGFPEPYKKPKKAKKKKKKPCVPCTSADIATEVDEILRSVPPPLEEPRCTPRICTPRSVCTPRICPLYPPQTPCKECSLRRNHLTAESSSRQRPTAPCAIQTPSKPPCLVDRSVSKAPCLVDRSVSSSATEVECPKKSVLQNNYLTELTCKKSVIPPIRPYSAPVERPPGPCVCSKLSPRTNVSFLSTERCAKFTVDSSPSDTTSPKSVTIREGTSNPPTTVCSCSTSDFKSKASSSFIPCEEFVHSKYRVTLPNATQKAPVNFKCNPPCKCFSRSDSTTANGDTPLSDSVAKKLAELKARIQKVRYETEVTKKRLHNQFSKIPERTTRKSTPKSTSKSTPKSKRRISFNEEYYKHRGCPRQYTVFNFGERGSGFRPKGEVQDFYKLREYHVRNGTMFEDPDFPPTDSSLFYSQRPDRHYEWKRPGEIVNNPKLFVEGYSRFDVQQGELGDCWLLAAVANITLYRKLFFQVVPTDQDFEENYAGIFHFRFWQYGRWIDVVIDDKLPTYRGQLIFLHSTEENEFWSALLEKAYAKLHGSYEALKGGSTCEAMEDFTGGVTEMYEMNASPPNLFKIILKAYERSSLMGCSLEPDPNVLEAETPEGLIKGHAYSITKVKYVDIQTPNAVGKIPLLRLRNPWGNETEWNGPWSDKSPEWRFISDEEKEDLGLTFDDDGEFWMSFKDFQKHFDRLEICNLTPDSLTEEELIEGHKKRWEMSVFEGEWVRGVTAGGCRNFLETFWHNPQYRITLVEPDDNDDDGKCTLIVALMQKNRRAQRNMGMDVLTIGFAIYHLPYPDRVSKPLSLDFFKYNASVARSPSFINLREVSCRFKLPPGTYCIVPSTFDPNEEGEFLLRVFSEHKNNMEENDEEVGYGEVDDRVSKSKKVKSLKAVKEMRPTAEEDAQASQVRAFFQKLAGEDNEVDWIELKEILDYAMRSEMPINKASANGLDAAPPTETQTPGDNLITTILGLLCGALCKDTPLADIIPPPAEASQTMSSFKELGNKGFSNDICRSMVAMLDADRSGKLGFEEFKQLWSNIRDWKLVFKMYDKDNSTALSGFELRQALNSAGYHLNNHILNILMHRYGNKKRELEFSDFIMCAVKLKCMIDIFKEKDPSNTNSATFTMEEWMEKTLYC